jgi:WD40 repeat protein
MEFIDGPNLREWIDTEPRRFRDVLAVYMQAGRGLAAAHRAGIVHRDFKPENAIVGTEEDGSERVRVLDFGLARGTGEPTPEIEEGDDPALSGSHVLLTPLTKSGAIMGTPAYMAPEQHLGLPSDERTDQFSFCVALYEALYGARPFAGTTLGKLRNTVLDGEIAPPPRDREVPGWVRRVLVRGLSREPEDRFESMEVLLLELGRDPAALVRRVLAVVAVGVALGVAWMAWSWREQHHAEEQARLAARAGAEERRAEAAEQQLVTRADKLTLAEIDAYLDRDPTRAVANLLNLSASSPAWGGGARLIASDARYRGIARDVTSVRAGEVPHALSPDGRILVTRQPDSGRLLLRDLVESSERELVPGSDGVPVVAISPDGRSMAALNAPAGVTLWDATGRDARTLGDVREGHYGIAWAPDGKAFVTFGRNPEADVWTTAGDRKVLNGHAEEVEHAVLTRGRAATVDVTGTVRLFDLGSNMVWSQRGLGPLAFGPDGVLATATNLAGVQLLQSPERGDILEEIGGWVGADTPARAIAFRPGAPELAIGLADGQVRLWSIDSDEERVIGVHDDGVVALRFDRDGGALVSQSLDRTLAVTDLSSRRRQVLKGHDGIGFWALDSDGREIVTVGWEGEVRRWDLKGTRRQPKRAAGAVTAIAIHERSFVGTQDGVVAVFDQANEDDPTIIDRVHGSVTSLLALKGGALVVSTDRGSVFELDDEGVRRELLRGAGEPVAVAASPDGRWLRAGGVEGRIVGWDRSSGGTKTEQTVAGIAVQRLAVRDGGHTLIAGWSKDGTSWLVEMNGDEDSARHRLGADGILGVAFDPERTRVAWSTHTREIRLFEDGHARTLGQHPALVDQMTFDPTSTTLVTVGHDGSVMLWDTVSGRYRGVEISRRPLRAVAYDPRESLVVSGGDDRRILFVRDDLPHDPEALRQWIRDSTSLRIGVEPRG